MSNVTHTYLGFDFGTKRIGIAVGQDVTKTAKPLKNINAKAGVPDWKEIIQLVRQWSPTALIVGIPYNMDGSEQATTLLARAFAKQLAHHTQLTVHEVDERLSTVAAREHVFERRGYKGLQETAMDAVAAQMILEGWMAGHEK